MKVTSSIIPHIVSIGLIAAGAIVCASTGKSLASDKDLRLPLNPFGINTSPYGEVIAMAMQGPMDDYWRNSVSSRVTNEPHPGSRTSFRDGTRMFIESLERASVDRTNPRPASEAQKRFLRRQIEDKLRFAYELDPGHYGNYASYHFFLTEPAVGTRRHLTIESVLLADRTINYCFSRSDDPRHALTAAAAAGNVLLLMFNETSEGRARFPIAKMKEYLAILDKSIARYESLSAGWEKTGNWSLLSDSRIIECRDRFSYILKTREVSVKTIRRIEAAQSASTSLTRNPSSLSS
ncbi:MAG TPA: hypothetical protein VM511_04975 [Luteolibacter sp.]|nr:hypothetical protein [Luteolibacter sp.]